MIRISEHRLQQGAGYSLHAQLRSVEEGGSRPVVVFSHGFITNGLENHGMFMRIARECGRAGFSSVLFDFFGAGYSDGDYTDFRLSNAGADLAATAEWAASTAKCNGEVVLFGQSLGTAACAIALGTTAARVAAVILWNLSANFATRYPRLFGEAILQGEEFCVEHKGYRVGADFLSDAMSHDVLALLQGRTEPTLFVSCTGDNIGDLELARTAASRMAGETGSIEYPAANHSFWCQGDLEKRAAADSIAWLAGTLEGGRSEVVQRKGAEV